MLMTGCYFKLCIWREVPHHSGFVYGAAVLMVTKICGRWQEKFQLRVYMHISGTAHSGCLVHLSFKHLSPLTRSARFTLTSFAFLKAASSELSWLRIQYFDTDEYTFLSDTEQNTVWRPPNLLSK
jgi:hypothetical protein